MFWKYSFSHLKRDTIFGVKSLKNSILLFSIIYYVIISIGLFSLQLKEDFCEIILPKVVHLKDCLRRDGQTDLARPTRLML